MNRCQFSSYDAHDAVYLEEYYFNKMLIIQYNSTLGKAVGYTKEAKKIADQLNSRPSFLIDELWKTDVCKKNVPQAYNGLMTPGE